jgi:hypothetical protein
MATTKKVMDNKKACMRQPKAQEARMAMRKKVIDI